MIGEQHQLFILEDLVDLSNSIYAGSEIASPIYLEWEYLLNPNGHAIVFIAKDDSAKTVAQYVVIPTLITDGEMDYRGSLSLNTLTHPNFQGLGLFRNLASNTFSKCVDQDINFTYGFPNGNSFPGFIEKLKFINVGELLLFVKPVRPIHALAHFLCSNSKKIDVEIDLNNLAEKDGVSNCNLEKDKNEVNRFCTKILLRKNIGTKRTAEWLIWRYSTIPIRKYSIVKEEKNGEIVSLAVFRAKIIKGVRTGVLVDFLSSEKKSGLVSYIKQLAILNQLDVFISTVPDLSNESQLLKKAGFWKWPSFLTFKKLPLIVKEHTSNHNEKLFKFSNWFITFGDYDIF